MIKTSGPTGRPRVVIADDHKLLTAMLAATLKPEFEIVATVGDRPALLDVVGRMRPDIALMDVIMSGIIGLDAGRQVLATLPGLKLMYLTERTDEALAAEAFVSGASAYLVKDCSAEELLRVARLIAAGGRYLSPTIRNGDLTELQSAFPAAVKTLSSRECQVVTMLVNGQSMKQVARQLGIAPRTVAFHKYHVMESQKLRGNQDLMEFALRHGLLGARTATKPGISEPL